MSNRSDSINAFGRAPRARRRRRSSRAPSSRFVCRLIDYSRGGACLEIFPMVALPDRFELLHGSVKKKSRVVWRRGIRVGVAF